LQEFRSALLDCLTISVICKNKSGLTGNTNCTAAGLSLGFTAHHWWQTALPALFRMSLALFLSFDREIIVAGYFTSFIVHPTSINSSN
jgi:hypothetical protein